MTGIGIHGVLMIRPFVLFSRQLNRIHEDRHRIGTSTQPQGCCPNISLIDRGSGSCSCFPGQFCCIGITPANHTGTTTGQFGHFQFLQVNILRNILFYNHYQLPPTCLIPEKDRSENKRDNGHAHKQQNQFNIIH